MILTPWGVFLLEEPTGAHLAEKFPAGPNRVHNSLPPVPILCQINPVHDPILILSFHLCFSLPSALFPSGFPLQNPICTSHPPMRAICPAHLILLDFITRLFDEEYKQCITICLVLPKEYLC
jgi:hypothetical protein